LENRAGKILLDFDEASRAANTAARRNFLTGDDRWSSSPVLSARVRLPLKPELAFEIAEYLDTKRSFAMTYNR
jgi:hypothetical protein